MSVILDRPFLFRSPEVYFAVKWPLVQSYKIQKRADLKNSDECAKKKIKIYENIKK